MNLQVSAYRTEEAETRGWTYRTEDSPRRPYTSRVTEYNPGDAKGFIDNRRERMRLNLGGLSYELTELTTPSGWTCEMAVARGIPTTPVQILAYDSRHMISGALMLDIPDSLAYDPIATAPIIDAVTRDMTVMMKGLQ